MVQLIGSLVLPSYWSCAWLDTATVLAKYNTIPFHTTTQHWSPGLANRVVCSFKAQQQESRGTASKSSTKRGPTGIWTRIAGFRVQSANHYTIRPTQTYLPPNTTKLKSKHQLRDITQPQRYFEISALRRTQKRAPTGIWTRIAGFKVQSANHYTMGPVDASQNYRTVRSKILNFW